MTKSEAISILLKHASSDEVTKYIANTYRFGEEYFKRLNEEALISDFNARKYSA
ncbi:MAG: hypothetical protein ACOCQ5_01495 [Halanaerobiales bacterium]